MRLRTLLPVLALTAICNLNVAAQKPAAKPAASARAAATEASPGKLPVTRVVLYKNGVGYFEHTARVTGNQELTIPFNSAQLNDALKSLTAVDLGEGRITGIRYNSVAPVAERLKELGLPYGDDAGRNEFLQALRGSRVEVSSGTATALGRLLSVEVRYKSGGKPQADSDAPTPRGIEVTELSLVTDAGEVRTFEVTPSTRVRIADRERNDEVNRYLSLLGGARDNQLRNVTISTQGSGERQVFVSYISEVPVWKSTYRILLPAKPEEKTLLQGWAIVDNTVGEDWTNVKMSLVAGAPQSFVQDLSQPYYVRRPVVALPESVSMTPQSHEATVDSGVGLGGGSGSGTVGGVIGGIVAPPPNVAMERVEVQADARQRDKLHAFATLPRTVSDQAPVFRSSVSADSLAPAEATGKEAGDLFEYDLKDRITIGKNQSALVPIIHAKVEAEKVTLVSGTERLPERALWLNNSSGQELDGGAFNVIDSDTFAGEGILDPIKPGERRLISYAADTAIHLSTTDAYADRPISHLHLENGIMTTTQQHRAEKLYKLRNADASPRTVVLEHPVRSNWRLADGVKPEETTASFYRFRVAVKPASTQELKVEEVSDQYYTYQFTNMSEDQVAFLAKQIGPNPKLDELFRKISGKKREIALVDEQIRNHQSELQSIASDQSRIRENMKALKGSAEERALVQRYTGQLNDQETRLDTLKKEMEDLEKKRSLLRQELDLMLQGLVMDEEV